MKHIASATVFALCALAAGNTLAAQHAYTVSLEVREAGELRSAPMAIVRANTDASVASDGENWFKLDFSVSPTGTGSVRFNAVYESATGTLAAMAEMEPGRTATLASDDVEIAVTVEPADTQVHAPTQAAERSR